MKTISILVTPNALIGPLGNARNVFTAANDLLIAAEKEPFFDVSLVSSESKVYLDRGLYTVKVDKTFHEITHTDLVIIPPMSGCMHDSVNQNTGFPQWLKQQYKSGAEIASLSEGAFILAETGLLDGKECSVRMQSEIEFKKLYPQINLVCEKNITDYCGIYTAGCFSSCFNLPVYLVEKYMDKEIAIQISKFLDIGFNKSGQKPFLIFEGYKFHKDELVFKSQNYIEDSYSEKITIACLAEMANLSKRTFQRRFKKATKNTVSEYIQKVKVEAAKKYLESGKLSISETMYEVGYNDPKAFRETFKKMAGITPFKYRERYSD